MFLPCFPIDVKVVLQYTSHTKESTHNVHGRSSIKDLLTTVAKGLPTTFKGSNLIASQNNVDISNTSKCVEYNLDTPFYISEYLSVTCKTSLILMSIYLRKGWLLAGFLIFKRLLQAGNHPV